LVSLVRTWESRQIFELHSNSKAGQHHEDKTMVAHVWLSFSV